MRGCVRWVNVATSLPFDFRFIGPPRQMSSTPAYCSANGFTWIEVYPEQSVTRPDPVCINYPASRMREGVFDSLPAAGVAILPNARVVGEDGWIVGRDHTFLPDHSWFGAEPAKCPIFRAGCLKPDHFFSGRTATLASDFAVFNYGHTVHDAIARVHLLEKAGLAWPDIDRVIVPDLRSEGRRRLAAIAGIPFEKIVNASTLGVAECETLIAPTFPGLRRNTPPWVAEFWAGKAKAVPVAKRRLYISRKGEKRSVSNEDEVVELLGRYGFEVLVPGRNPVFDQFQSAEMVVGTHGAAMADAVFCPLHSVFIELTPSKHIYPYDYTIATAANMRYISVLAESDESCRDPEKANIRVPIAYLKQSVELGHALLQEHSTPSAALGETA
ncbi:MAG TPA: glycosyltransferase family 61 protein [Bryobacteraceae bacterium]|nr:glycosyltransferase family 61 protein [Bryobacteraceae bacterium]